jgi:serine/threonine-protein kinase
VTRRTDVFAAGIVLWEALTGARLFAGDNEGHVIMRVLEAPIVAPSELRAEVGPDLDAIVLRALERAPERRFGTARELALALEECGAVASSVVGTWVEKTAHHELAERAARVAAIERSIASSPAAAPRGHEPTVTATAVPPNDTLPTENAISLEPPLSPQPAAWRRRVIAGGAIGVTLITVALWVGGRPKEAPASAPPEAISTSATAPQDITPPEGSAPPMTPVSATPVSSVAPSLAKSTRAGRGGITPPKVSSSAVQAPSAVASPTAAPKEHPFYRFE